MRKVTATKSPDCIGDQVHWSNVEIVLEIVLEIALEIALEILYISIADCVAVAFTYPFSFCR